jgi:hypothetical protein
MDVLLVHGGRGRIESAVRLDCRSMPLLQQSEAGAGWGEISARAAPIEHGSRSQLNELDRA